MFVHRPTTVACSLLLHDALPIFGLQLSLAVTPPRTSGTVAWQFASAKALGVAEQITVGAVLSVTTKLDVQVTLLHSAYVAVTYIVFVPKPNSVPARGLWLKVIALVGVQLSLTL